MRQTTLLLVIPALLAAGHSPAAGADGPEPVNVIAETELDVGPCKGGGTLSYPPTPYKGTAYFLRKADATLARRHETLTGQSGASAAWIRRLDGPSSANRLFTAANGDTLVATFTGQATVVSPGVLSVLDTATISGGTGRFAGAIGSFTTERVFVMATGSITGSFEGTISSPGASKR